MKKLIIFLTTLSAIACNNAASPVASNPNSPSANNTSGTPQTVLAHSSENGTPPAAAPASGEKGKWTQSGEPIDTKTFDAAIVAAERALTAKPADATLKKTVSVAYYKRAVALTEARQYASALGDYRKALKNDASNTEAKDWIEKIIMIYDGLNKTSPKEGEEPPPLPFTKDK